MVHVGQVGNMVVVGVVVVEHGSNRPSSNRIMMYILCIKACHNVYSGRSASSINLSQVNL